MTATETARARVLELSVYNAVNVSLRNSVPAGEVAMFLRLNWIPAWAPASTVCTVDAVAHAADRMVKGGLLFGDRSGYGIPNRAEGHLGPLMDTDWKTLKVAS